MATDPSYFGQILVLTAPQQGNYGEDDKWWESRRIWIEGFVCLELQNSWREKTWKQKLIKNGVPILTDVDTRTLTLRLREHGTPWGALVNEATPEKAIARAKVLIAEKKKGEKD